MQTRNQGPNIHGMTPYVAIAAGLLIAVLGFGLDLVWHNVSGIDSHEEAVVTTSNPGHLMVAVGGAVALAATAVGLWRSNRIVAVSLTTVIAVAAVSFAVYGSIGIRDDSGGLHTHEGGSASDSHHLEMQGATGDEN